MTVVEIGQVCTMSDMGTAASASDSTTKVLGPVQVKVQRTILAESDDEDDYYTDASEDFNDDEDDYYTNNGVTFYVFLYPVFILSACKCMS